jgi:hypothetical protein
MFIFYQWYIKKSYHMSIIRNRKSNNDRQYNVQKKQRTEVQTMIYKALHRKLKIE